ncbi:MAG: hypothetical protein JST84_28170 [Acidobacteria bacterium]|nr:hypothetical protein [Acidobacteriota bacterium]
MITSNRTHKLLAIMIGLMLGVAGCKQTPTAPATGEKANGTTATSSASSGGCYNAYYPASATLKRTYKSSYSGNNFPPSTFTETYSNFTSESFMHKMEFAPYEMKSKTGQTVASSGAVVVESGVKCKPDGLMALESGNLNAGQNVQYKYKTVKTEGISYPVESDWKVGKKWDLQYEIEGEFAKTPLPNMTAPKGTMNISSEIVGKESVTVPAGTFEAFKVSMTMTNKMVMKMNGKEMPMNNTVKSTAWFAKDVGMVKSLADVGGASTELVSITK